MDNLTIKDLLEAGVHFGHQTRRWNPKMKKFIFTERNDIYIIDLKKTLGLINDACNIVRETVAKGDSVLFVGTKTQAANIVKDEAERSGQYYVINRWLGGMLTNYRTIRQSVKKLEHYEKMSTDGTYELLTKKEVLTNEKNKDKLLGLLGGIRDMNRIPGILIVVDTKKENIAVREANRLGIPVCAIIDTNCDPDPIDFPIPGNDDAIRSIKVILSRITDAILEGLQLRADKEEAAPEPPAPAKKAPAKAEKAAVKPAADAKAPEKAAVKPDAAAKAPEKAPEKAAKDTAEKPAEEKAEVKKTDSKDRGAKAEKIKPAAKAKDDVKAKETEKPVKEIPAKKKTDDTKAPADDEKKKSAAKADKDTKEKAAPKKSSKKTDKTDKE
ncbi:30S ribosomal protein S2 [Candidatus Latescibacterota bacterium]